MRMTFSAFYACHIIASQRNVLVPETVDSVEALSIVLGFRYANKLLQLTVDNSTFHSFSCVFVSRL